jgi:hypothetical protein
MMPRKFDVGDFFLFYPLFFSFVILLIVAGVLSPVFFPSRYTAAPLGEELTIKVPVAGSGSGSPFKM